MLTETDEIKYLGVIIDYKITWFPHITYVTNKVSKGIGIMFKKEIISREIQSLICIIRIYTII